MSRLIRNARKTAAAFSGAVVLLAACDRPPSEKIEPAPAPSPKPEQAPAIAPPSLPAIDRAQLLNALDAAASAYAAGAAVETKDLAGRRFVVRQAFGCRPPVTNQGLQPGSATWSQGRSGEAVDISLTPAEWTRAPIMAEAGAPWEAVEGFWIDRPWMRTEGCPASAPAEPDVAAPAPLQTAGLASVFEVGGSRVLRRDGKPFRYTLRGKAIEVPEGGLRLVLEGRFAAFPDGGAVRCRATSPDARPVCIAAAQVDRVAFEDAEGAVLSEWRLG